MKTAEQTTYLLEIINALKLQWPENRTVNIVCHGHSVPAGYFATPVVDSLNSYPHLLHVELKRRFPFAVINVIVTAIGGENSESGAKRFERDVLCHRPDIITIDYGLNDRRIGLDKSQACWSKMIQAGLSAGVKVILLTPTPDNTQMPDYTGADKDLLPAHAEQIRALAAQYGTGLADSFAACMKHAETSGLATILSWVNHPNRAGHDLVVHELRRWFPAE
jgi:acyl-CoA thioesterase-1